MARAATTDELVKLRSDGQRSKLFLLVQTPNIIYRAQVNQTSFSDPVSEINYDYGSGTFPLIIPGMTMYVGTTYDGWDLGAVRIRKTPTSTTFYIGEGSEIPWANNLYLTIVNEIGVWPRHPRLVGTSQYMDFDIPYSDQHANFEPYPMMGPGAVLKLPAGGTVSYTPNASESWVFGSTITGYTWFALGASSVQNGSTATPTINYTNTGIYRVQLTITAANGKTAVGHRIVQVYSDAVPPITDFELLSCQHDRENGGWEFSVRVYAGVDSIRPRARVLLCADDWYGSASGSIGPVAGAENIIAVGWIDGESITPNPETGTVEFAVRGPHHWLKNITCYPMGVERTTNPAAAWTEMQGLTVDRALWHMLHWRSTISMVMDAYLPGNTLSLPAGEAPTSSIWEQLMTIAGSTILATPDTDRYGRLFIQTDVQHLPSASRSGIPTVMDLTQDDWDEINIERAPTRQCSLLELSGILDDTNEPIMSRARGNVFTLYGSAQSIESLLLDNQSQANELAGNVFSQLNNEFPAIDLTLRQNNRLVDTCPLQRLTLSVSAADTPRGIVWVSKLILPRRIEHKFDPKSGFLHTIVECEAETGGASVVPGITIPITPPPLIGDLPFQFPDFNKWGAWPALAPGDLGLPGFMPQDPPIDPVANTCPTDAPANGPYYLNIVGLLQGDIEAAKFGHIPAQIRTSTHANKTRYEIRAIFEKNVSGVWGETLEDSFYNVYAHAPGGAIIATGVHDPVTNPRVRTGVLTAAVAQKIAYISIQINVDLLRPTSVTTYQHGANSWANLGTLTWGYFGNGIWASYQGLSGNHNGSPWTRWQVQQIIDINGVTGSLKVRHNGYAQISTGSIDMVVGSSYYPADQFWSESPSGSVWLTDKHERIFNTGHINIVWEGPIGPSGGQSLCHHWLTAYKVQTYRINLLGMSAYNLCPLTAWDTWLPT